MESNFAELQYFMNGLYLYQLKFFFSFAYSREGIANFFHTKVDFPGYVFFMANIDFDPFVFFLISGTLAENKKPSD